MISEFGPKFLASPPGRHGCLASWLKSGGERRVDIPSHQVAAEGVEVLIYTNV